MNNWPTVKPHMRERVENEVRSGILRDRNRACIVQWEIFNEIYREDLGRLKHADSGHVPVRAKVGHLVVAETKCIAGFLLRGAPEFYFHDGSEYE